MNVTIEEKICNIYKDIPIKNINIKDFKIHLYRIFTSSKVMIYHLSVSDLRDKFAMTNILNLQKLTEMKDDNIENILANKFNDDIEFLKQINTSDLERICRLFEYSFINAMGKCSHKNIKYMKSIYDFVSDKIVYSSVDLMKYYINEVGINNNTDKSKIDVAKKAIVLYSKDKTYLPKRIKGKNILITVDKGPNYKTVEIDNNFDIVISFKPRNPHKHPIISKCRIVLTIPEPMIVKDDTVIDSDLELIYRISSETIDEIIYIMEKDVLSNQNI